jgi:hypothetical protein
MQVRFLVQGGASQLLTVPDDCTVSAAKELLATSASIPSDSLLLVHRATTLADDIRLSTLDLTARPYIFVGTQSEVPEREDPAFFADLFAQIPAPKALKYRLRLERNPHLLKSVVSKICRHDPDLIERLLNHRDLLLQFLKINIQEFVYRSVLRVDEPTDDQQAEIAPPNADDGHTFDAYPENFVTADFSGHVPADKQPELPDESAPDDEDGSSSIELTDADVDAIRRLCRLGLSPEYALRLYLKFGRSEEAVTTMVANSQALCNIA